MGENQRSPGDRNALVPWETARCSRESRCSECRFRLSNPPDFPGFLFFCLETGNNKPAPGGLSLMNKMVFLKVLNINLFLSLIVAITSGGRGSGSRDERQRQQT